MYHRWLQLSWVCVAGLLFSRHLDGGDDRWRELWGKVRV